MTKKKTWKNRIVGDGIEDPAQLLANPFNFRLHPKDQQEALHGSMDSLGWIQEIIINQNTQHIIDGHLRVVLALRHGQTEIPVTYVKLTEDEERQALLSLDPITQLAATDKAMLQELIDGIKTSNDELLQFMADLREREGLLELETQHKDTDELDDEGFDLHVIRFRVNPVVQLQYEELLEQLPGATQVEKFSEMVNRLEARLSQ